MGSTLKYPPKGAGELHGAKSILQVRRKTAQLPPFLHPKPPQRFGRGKVWGIRRGETRIRNPSVEEKPLLHSIGLPDRKDAHTDAILRTVLDQACMLETPQQASMRLFA
eukprot:4056493-Pyramimonas_sp.AAC.1